VTSKRVAKSFGKLTGFLAKNGKKDQKKGNLSLLQKKGRLPVSALHSYRPGAKARPKGKKEEGKKTSDSSPGTGIERERTGRYYSSKM